MIDFKKNKLYSFFGTNGALPYEYTEYFMIENFSQNISNFLDNTSINIIEKTIKNINEKKNIILHYILQYYQKKIKIQYNSFIKYDNQDRIGNTKIGTTLIGKYIYIETLKDKKIYIIDKHII